MGEIDGLLLRTEFNLTALLVVQFILAVLSGLFAFLSSRLWARSCLVLTLVLAVAACGGTLYQCALAKNSAEGRLAGQVPGQHLPPGRLENHLAWVKRWRWGSIGLVAATVVGGGVLFYVMRGRARPASAPDV